jgi:DNA polymerase-1
MPRGFFGEIRPPVKIARPRHTGINKTWDCETCGLYKQCHSPKMPYTGEGRLRILIIAEAPGKQEDQKGIQLIGDAGQLLRQDLKPYGLDLDLDFWKINAINCHPPDNRDPEDDELRSCWHVLVQPTIEKLKPNQIWLMGKAAVKSYYLYRDVERDSTMDRWRGRFIPDRKYNCWIVPMLHPSYVLRNRPRPRKPWEKEREDFFNPGPEAMWRKDLKRAILRARRPASEYEDERQHVHRLIRFSDVVEVLDKLLQPTEKKISFDYEATSLKPWLPNQKIWSVGFALSSKEAYAFPLEYPYWKAHELQIIRDKWVQVLQALWIKKIAHYLKFEDKWSFYILGAEILGWLHDTMVTSHILNNARATHSLKFQVFVGNGIEGYDNEANRYMKVPSGHDSNIMDRMPLEEILMYQGLDALETFWLYEQQSPQLEMARAQAGAGHASLYDADQLFLDGNLTFRDMERDGVVMDLGYYQAEEKKIGDRIDSIEADILTSDAAQYFRTTEGRPMSVTSNDDIGHLLYDLLGNTTSKKTKKGGKNATDEEALSEFAERYPWVQKILDMRGESKVQDYVKGFQREITGSVVHPNMNLHTVISYRSSCNDPNLQNVPIHDEKAMMAVRMGIRPLPGCHLGEMDFGSHEVRVTEIFSRDVQLYNYIMNPKTDMHRDQAIDIFQINFNESPKKDDAVKAILKDLRFQAKNNFTFAEIYGAYYKSVAKNIWKAMITANLRAPDGTPMRQWLKMNYEDFEQHLKEVEERFWAKFFGVREWQINQVEKYIRDGYIETPMGFRYIGNMTKNQIFNLPIQGTAFHLLLWSLVRINRELRAQGFKSRAVLQIHDSILFNLYPDEINAVFALADHIMTVETRKAFDWINVPLLTEAELAPQDQPWALKRSYEGYKNAA